MFDEINMFIDGCSKGNPGQAGAGVFITTTNQQVLLKKSYPLGVTTNNVAEYLALLLGLQELERFNFWKKVNIFSDSLLLVNQLNGKYKINDSKLKSLHEKTLAQLSKLQDYSITHIPRSQNHVADQLANEAIKNGVNKNV